MNLGEAIVGRGIDLATLQMLVPGASMRHGKGREGSPLAGTPLMVASPLLALELPLKVLTWQDSSSQVWVSNTSAEYLAERFTIPAELAKSIAGVDGLIAAVLQS